MITSIIDWLYFKGHLFAKNFLDRVSRKSLLLLTKTIRTKTM